MEDRFTQQLKKGVLEMLVLELICAQPTYGYELLSRLKETSRGLFTLKEGWREFEATVNGFLTGGTKP